MGKRSSFERRERDYYRTPYKAVLPLLPHLFPGTRFAEPCAGDGRLIGHLTFHGHKCVWACDVQPERSDILLGDATACVKGKASVFITNPPWRRDWLHPIIVNLARQAPTWLLFDADWAHTKQSVPYMSACRKIVPVGRVRWFEGTKQDGKDNCCWYLFDATNTAPTIFVPAAK